MKLFPLLIGFFFMAAAQPAVCDEGISSPIKPHQAKSPAEPRMDYNSLIVKLRNAGVSALPGEAVDQPFFSVQGRMIEIGGEDVQIFQYPHVAAAAEQAALVSPDGSAVGTSMVHWIEPPHFFRKESLIVLYVGGNEKVIKALEAVLGRQFAGK